MCNLRRLTRMFDSYSIQSTKQKHGVLFFIASYKRKKSKKKKITKLEFQGSIW